MELGKEELISCCHIDSGYDISISQREEGWQVSAMPKQKFHPSGELMLTAGGDIHLYYDPYGVLRHVYRGQ